jgi:hypothetical protein
LLLGAITERRGEKEKAAVELKQPPEIRCRRGPAVLRTRCDRTAQNSSVLSPKPVHVAIKQ